VDYLDAHAATTVTVEHALAWALRPGCAAAWQAQRLAMVRGFATYLHTIDPATQIPPPGLLRGRWPRATPYLYSTAEVAAHRLFSFISMNWRGRPLTDYQVVVETIAATTTETGLTVAAVLDTNTYPTGVKISDAQMRALPVQRYAFHGEWNYVVHSGPTSEFVQNQTISL
jgi:hypothetical protein